MRQGWRRFCWVERRRFRMRVVGTGGRVLPGWMGVPEGELVLSPSGSQRPDRWTGMEQTFACGYRRGRRIRHAAQSALSKLGRSQTWGIEVVARRAGTERHDGKCWCPAQPSLRNLWRIWGTGKGPSFCQQNSALSGYGIGLFIASRSKPRSPELGSGTPRTGSTKFPAW
jgi:hypothetical protein